MVASPVVLARIYGPPEQVIIVGAAAAAYGIVIVRCWRGFARHARRWAMGSQLQKDKLWGTLEEPKRLLISVIGYGFIVWGATALIAGLANL